MSSFFQKTAKNSKTGTEAKPCVFYHSFDSVRKACFDVFFINLCGNSKVSLVSLLFVYNRMQILL